MSDFKVGDEIEATLRGKITHVYDDGMFDVGKHIIDPSAADVKKIRPAVKVGQVWRIRAGLLFFVTAREIFTPACSAIATPRPKDSFFRLYPDAELVFDPDAA